MPKVREPCGHSSGMKDRGEPEVAGMKDRGAPDDLCVVLSSAALVPPRGHRSPAPPCNERHLCNNPETRDSDAVML